jgi:hypothetical protein
MTHRLRHTALFAASLAAVLALSACGKSEPPAAAAPAAAASTIAPPTTNIQAPPAAATSPSPASSSAIALAATSSTLAPAAAPPVAALSVAKVALGSEVNAEHQVAKSASSFASTDKTIYASVATEGSSSGATLNAKWTYLEGTSQLVSSISQSIATDGPAITTFKVQNPDLWPEGKYQVEISLNGKSVAKQSFEIKKG